MSKLVNFKLDKNQRDRVDELHGKAYVINALTGCHGWRSPWREFGKKRAHNLIEMGLKGGVTVNSLSLGGNSTSEAALSIIEWDNTMTFIQDKTKKILTVDDIRKTKQEGKSGYIINFQNTTALEGKLSSVDLFHRLGLRILQLTYQKANLVGDGCGSKRAAVAGLTDFGVLVVERLNKLQIVVDLSHVGHATTMETLEISKQPPAFTHTNCHGTYGFKFMRGKSDEELQAMAERGGVAGMTCIARFIRNDGDLKGSTINHYLDHVDYAVNLIGADHVGIGLDINEGLTPDDYYGIHKQTYEARFQNDPTSHVRRKHPYEHYYVFGLETVKNIKYITEGLVVRGYSDDEIIKILGGNWYRYFNMIWGR